MVVPNVNPGQGPSDQVVVDGGQRGSHDHFPVHWWFMMSKDRFVPPTHTHVSMRW